MDVFNYPSDNSDMQAGYTIQFSNFTDWSFADPSYVPKSKANYVALSTSKPAVLNKIELSVNTDTGLF